MKIELREVWELLIQTQKFAPRFLTAVAQAWRQWVLVLAYTGFLLWVSLIPGDNMPPVWGQSDKVFHAVSFLVLGVLGCWALRSSFPGTSTRLIFVLLILGAGGFGLFCEWRQSFVPDRGADPWDLAADVVGGTLGVVFYLKGRWR